MREQSEIMNESISPCSERWLDVPESSVISDHPNIPPGSKNHLRKERFVELLSSMVGNLHHVLTVFPDNLQIDPDSSTEIALEKKVVSVLQDPSWTQNTLWTLINLPLPPLNHVLSINHVHYNKPSKHLDRHCKQLFQIHPRMGFATIG